MSECQPQGIVKTNSSTRECYLNFWAAVASYVHVNYFANMMNKQHRSDIYIYMAARRFPLLNKWVEIINGSTVSMPRHAGHMTAHLAI
jgi:hypothetical protein